MTGDADPKRRASIALIGLRGCGKSTVGRELAKLLGGECLDTDGLVGARAGKTIAAVFAEEGEAGFRRREREVIEEITANPPAVISVGGGAILDDRNVGALRRVAVVVWLTAPVDVLWHRVSADDANTTSRPPLTDTPGQAEIELLLDQRSPLYRRAADLAIDTERMDPRQVAHEVLTRLGRADRLGHAGGRGTPRARRSP